MESEEIKIVSLPIQALTANDYNPNEMTEDEFSQLVSEVKHLGRLPKPIIVRPNGEGYVIVDGEHGWRAAKEVNLSEIPCEVVEVDDFEAMRQTYKRNQHGTHNPVQLGKMFNKMKKERKLSNRALAKEIEVSEGTIRNALLYTEVAKVRNDYAFENLSVKQIRYASMLPERVRNLWLDSGADIPALFNAIAPKKAKQLISKRKRDIESWLDTYGPPEWEVGSTAEEAFLSLYHILIEGGLFDTYHSQPFQGSTFTFFYSR